MDITLKELFQNFDLPSGSQDLIVKGLSCDSREVKDGHVFFALSGTENDGMLFAKDAEDNGAIAIVHDSKHSIESKIPQIHCENARKALAEIACRFHEHPSRDFFLCGITGTNGKTTLTYLLHHFLEETGVIGTVNIRFRDRIENTKHTTPDAISLQGVFSEMKSENLKNVVMEVSSHALEQHRADYSDFDCAVFTNITRDHLDYHKDMQSYFEAKKRLFTEILPKSTKTNKFAVINLDSAYANELIESVPNEIAIKTFSTQNENADLFLCGVKYSLNGTKAKLKLNQNDEFEVETNLIGKHNVENIMAALHVSLSKNISLTDLQEKLKKIEIPGRLERIGNKSIFVDYAHTPDALENVIAALGNIPDFKKGRLIVVFGCGGDRDKTKREPMGEIVAKHADVSIITNDNPRTEDPRDIVNDILEGTVKFHSPFDENQGYICLLDRESALKKAIEIAKPDDVILIAGKGHEDYQIIGEEKRYFDDREILKALLTT